MSFELLAPHYTWMEKILAGRRLQRSRVAWLEELDGRERILIAGVGHGHFLSSCAKRYPSARFTCVDASAGMLRRAEQNARAVDGNLERIQFVRGSLPDWRPARGQFDAIVTHFFLDCFPPGELSRVVAILGDAARADAGWLISDFAMPPRGLARQRAMVVHALMYAFFRRVTAIRARRLTEPDPFLAAAGFTLARRRGAEWGLLRSDLWLRSPAPERHNPASAWSKR